MKRTLLAAALVGVLATVGTATAAKLITGKNIKDGSVGYVDISKTAKKKLTAPRGPRVQQVRRVARAHRAPPGRTAPTAAPAPSGS